MTIQASVAKKFGETREGKGFSKDELQEVGLDFHQALKLRLPIDQRRRTKRTENVKTIKQFLGKK